MAKVYGHTQGLKPNQLKRLGNLYRRRLELESLILPEQARDLARLSHELGRQVGLLINRQGEVVQVLAGYPDHMPAPDISRLRRGRTRLAGYHFLRTSLSGHALESSDLALLGRLRLDMAAVMEVSGEGAGLMEAAHLLPRPEEGQDYRQLEVFAPGRPPENLALLVRALEEELERLSPPLEIQAQGAAILISVSTLPRQDARLNLLELAELARSAGLQVVDSVIQRVAKPNPRTLLGPGKLGEVLLLALRRGASVLVFDQELSPSQSRYLAENTQSDLKFMDRTQLILDIFAQRAKSREGKLQVEMAQLRYLSPRLASLDDGLSRLTGGIGGRGPGETKLEMDRRRVRQRLHRLGKELQKVSKQRKQRRKGRKKHGLPVLSIVGYTNAGKSTLLNALTGSRVLSENRLFATLDPTTRRLRFPKERDVIITDTVGFIRDLPADLKQAFAATLEELDQADLLIHVADASHPQAEDQIVAVDNILDSLELGDTPRLVVLNKMDQVPPESLAMLVKRFDGVAISALNQGSLPTLVEKLQDEVDALGR